MGTRPASNPVRAVLWTLDRPDPPAELASALSRQGIAWTRATGPFDAFARVLEAQGGEARVLLLVEPESLPDWVEVLGALERFVPEVGCWGYRSSGVPRLAKLDRPRTRPEVVVRPARARSGPPALRLTDAPAPPERSEGDGSNLPARSLLTPEELEMLLADKPPEGPGR